VEDFDRALNYSFLLLKYRQRSSVEITQRLKKKKYSSSVIKKTTQYLEENNYINDWEFVKAFTKLSVEKGWGPKRIDFRLRQLGIPRDLRKQVLACDSIFRESLHKILEKKLADLREQRPPLPAKKIFQRLMRYSLARGFSYQDIYQEIENLEVKSF